MWCSILRWFFPQCFNCWSVAGSFSTSRCLWCNAVNQLTENRYVFQQDNASTHRLQRGTCIFISPEVWACNKISHQQFPKFLGKSTGTWTVSGLRVIFPGWPWVSRYQNYCIMDLLELRMMEVVVTTGTHTKLQSNCLVSEMTYTVSSGTLNSTIIPYHTSQIVTTNKPTASVVQAGCPSCHPTNSVTALNGRTGKRCLLTYLLTYLHELTWSNFWKTEPNLEVAVKSVSISRW